MPLWVDPGRVHLFDPETEVALAHAADHPPESLR
jgi:hypothetical protein